MKAVSLFVTSAVLATQLTMLGCAALKTAARTANDIAHDACGLFAAENKAALGMSVEDWCAVQANLDPFLDSILSAQRTSAQRMGIARNPE